MDTRAAPPLGILGWNAFRSRWVDQVLRWRADDILRKAELDRHLPSAGLLLDIGAGLGHLAEAVCDDGRRRCIGIDPCWFPPPPLVARVRRLAPDAFRMLHADAIALPFRTDSFDGAWCAFVLHHLVPADQERALAEAARVVRPGGVFVLIEDTPAGPATLRADRRLNFEGAAAPHHYRSPEDWDAVLAANGILPIASTPFTGVFPRVTLRRVQHRAIVCRVTGTTCRAGAPPSRRQG